jgi:hypothetical protein
MKGSLFPLGLCRFADGVLEAIADSRERLDTFLGRHARGDWGLSSTSERSANDRSILTGERILSRYRTANGTSLWILTEGDRSKTTVFLIREAKRR